MSLLNVSLPPSSPSIPPKKPKKKEEKEEEKKKKLKEVGRPILLQSPSFASFLLSPPPIAHGEKREKGKKRRK